MAVLVSLLAAVFDGYFPLPNVFLPVRSDYFSVQLKATVQVPFLDSPLDVSENIGTAGVKPGPIWIGVEGESLCMKNVRC
jgi:hypothetical protein